MTGPIGTEARGWVPPSQNAPVDPNTKLCVACGRYHGGAREGVLCLEREVVRQRALLAKLGQR